MDSTYTLKHQGRVMTRFEEKNPNALPLSIGSHFNDQTGEVALSIKVGTNEMLFTGDIVWELLNTVWDTRQKLLQQIDRYERTVGLGLPE